MTRPLGLVVLVLGAAAPAFAQEAGLGGEGAAGAEWSIDARLSLAAAAIDGDGPLAEAADGVLADGLLVISREDVLQNGVRLTWRGEARVQRDAPSRPRFAAALGSCAPADPGCPAGGGLSPVSPATGIAAGGTSFDEDLFATLEGASLTVAGPWGEGVIGLDSGVAARLDARAPQVLESVSALSPALDPTGLGMVRARNDVTGPSAKVSYLSPRWVGFRLGASFTPEADRRGVDFDPEPRGPGLASAELEDVWEGAVSFARRFRESGVFVRAAVTATQATSGSALTEFGDYQAWGAGIELEKDAWTGGVRWLSSDNAWRPGGGDYEAVEIGLTRQGDKWRVGVEAGWASDDLNATEGVSYLVGASRKFGSNFTVGAAWMSAEADFPVPGAPPGHTNVRNDGLVIELSVRK